MAQTPRMEDMLVDLLPDVYRYSVYVAKDRDRALEHAQDCMCRALRFRDKWDTDRDLKPWLFRIIRNLEIDHWRRARVRGSEMPLDGSTADGGVTEVSSAANQEAAIRLREVREDIGELHPRDREVLLRSVFEGRNHQEISEVMSIPVGTVKSRLSRARQQLSDRS